RASVRAAGPHDVLERDAVAGRADQPAGEPNVRCRANDPDALEPELDAAAQLRALGTILPREVAARHGGERSPVPRLEEFHGAIADATRGVRPDARRVRAELLEARPCPVEVLELEHLGAGDSLSIPARELHEDVLERATPGERSELPGHPEVAMPASSDRVHGLDQRVG